MSSAVTVRGLRELELTFQALGKEAKRALNAELRIVAEPIRSDAQTLAASSIPRIGPKWSKMRVGVTRTLVYVAPRQRGVKGSGTNARRRPKFADLLLDRAMDPALEKNKPRIEGAVEDLFERLANDWNRI